MAKTTQRQPSPGQDESATGEKGIRARYGGKLAKAINRAIRAEVDGGNAALDKLTQLAGAARNSRWKDKAGRDTPEAAAYFKHQQGVVGRMEADVRRRWGIPPDEGKEKRGAKRASKAGGVIRAGRRERPARPRTRGTGRG